MNGRKYWIDYAKVFGIFLVVLGHFTPCYRDDYSAQLLYSFHLPLFFIISGYLYKTSDSTTRKQLMGIIQRLIVPYVMLIMLGLGIQFIFIGGGGNLFNVNELKSIVLGRPLGRINAMWFVHALILIKMGHLVHESIRKWNKAFYYSSWILLLTYLTFIAITTETIFPAQVCSTLVAYPFYIFGTKFSVLENKFDMLSLAGKYIITLILLFCPFLAVQCNGFVDLWLNDFGRNIVLYYLFGISSSAGVLLFCKQFIHYPSKAIVELSNGTLLIVALHSIILYYLDGYRDVFTLRIILCIFVIWLFYFPILLCEKYCPILIGKKKKQ